MAESIQVELSGKLLQFVEKQTGENGLFTTVSEYIRALIRADLERAEAEKWHALHQTLLEPMMTPESAFTPFSVEEIQAAGRQQVRDQSL
jgi:antitoxin ParD1/3/4